MSDPVETPVTTVNSGLVPALVQPDSRPAPKAPLLPPPDTARKLRTVGESPAAFCCAEISSSIASVNPSPLSPQ